MKLEPQKILSGSDLQDALMAANTKAQFIDILCARAGQHGWFRDMPEGLFEKLQGYRSSPQKP